MKILFRFASTVAATAFCLALLASPRDAVASATLETIANGCPVREHDVIVRNIGELRHALAAAMPGDVIGIDGVVVVDDAEPDLLVTTPGVVLTCASADATLAGSPVVALIDIAAEDVTVKWLNVAASTERGILVSGPDAEISHNVISCVRTCVYVLYGENATVTENDVTAPGKYFGIAVGPGSEGTTVSNNLVEDCLQTCVNVSQTEDVRLESNTVRQCPNCMLFVESNNLNATGNSLDNCEFTCLYGVRSSQLVVSGNICDNPETGNYENCLRFAGPASDIEVTDNTINGFVGFFGGSGFETEDDLINVRFAENRITNGRITGVFMSDSVFENNRVESCTIVSFADDGCWRFYKNVNFEVAGNTIIGGPNDFFGIKVENIFNEDGIGSTIVVDNEITIAPEHNYELPPEVPAFGLVLTGNDTYVSGNTVRVTAALRDAIGIQVSGTGLGELTPEFRFAVFNLTTGELEVDYSEWKLARRNYIGKNRIHDASTGIRTFLMCDSMFDKNKFRHVGTGYHNVLASREDILDSDPYSGMDYLRSIGSGGTGNIRTVLLGDGSVQNHSTQHYSEAALGDGGELIGNGYFDCDGDGVPDPNTTVTGGYGLLN